VSTNEKNQRARGDYGVLHRSLEAADSKKNSDIVATLLPTVAMHYSLLFTVLFTALFTIFVDFSLSKSVDSDSATVELVTQQRMVAE
jgi:hypothetical protein